MSECSIIAYGTIKGNKFLNKFKGLFKFKIESDFIQVDDEKFDGIGYEIIAVTQNPYNESKGMVVYTSQSDKDNLNILLKGKI